MRLHYRFGSFKRLKNLFRKADKQIQFQGEANVITVQRRGRDDGAEIKIKFANYGTDEYYIISGKDAKRLSTALTDIFEDEPTQPAKTSQADSPVIRR